MFTIKDNEKDITKIKQCLNRSFKLAKTSNISCHTSSFTFLELLTKLCNDTTFKNNIHSKLKEWTSKQSNNNFCLTGNQFKPHKLDSFISVITKYLTTHSKEKCNCIFYVFYVIDFELNFEDDDIVNLYTTGIWKEGTVSKSFKHDKFKYHEYDHNYYVPWFNVIFGSVVGLNSIEKLGEAGFVAAFLLLLDWDLFEKKQQTDQEADAWHYTLTLNMTHSEKRESNDFFWEQYKKIPQNILDLLYFRRNLFKDIQIQLFNSYINIDNDSGDEITQYFDSNGKIIGTDTRKHIFGKTVLTQKSKGDMKEIFSFDRDLNVIGSKLYMNDKDITDSRDKFVDLTKFK